MRWVSKKNKSYYWGMFAEYYAACFLILKGYRVCSLRYKTKVGEIDIIATKAKTLCFVEVKFRTNFDKGIEAVTEKSQSRIRRAADMYILAHGDESDTIRFDVITINQFFGIRHICNAF